MGFAPLYPSYKLHHGPVPLDANAQDLVHRLVPPGVGKDLDLGIATKTLRLYRSADRTDVDDAVAHHAAVVENVLGRHQPVTDVEGEQPVAPRTRDLHHQVRVPPDVIDVERDAERAGAAGIEPVANVERLF